MAKYLPPEGFTLDPKNNLYYSAATITDSEGKTVTYITWFDANTGTYAQQSYSGAAAKPEIQESKTAEPTVELSHSRTSKKWLTWIVGGGAALALIFVAFLFLWPKKDPNLLYTLDTSGGFPVGSFVREDSAATLNLEGGDNPEEYRDFTLKVNALGDLKKAELSGQAQIQNQGTDDFRNWAISIELPEAGLEDLSAEVLDGVSFYAISDDEIRVYQGDGWNDHHEGETSPNGIYRRKDEAKSESKDDSDDGEQNNPNSGPNDKNLDRKNSSSSTNTEFIYNPPKEDGFALKPGMEKEPMYLQMTGMYEVVETGVKDLTTFYNNKLEGFWRPMGVPEDIGQIASDSMRYLLIENTVGAVGNADLKFVMGNSQAYGFPSMLVLNTEELGSFMSTPQLMEEFFVYQDSSMAYSEYQFANFTFGYEIGGAPFVWAEGAMLEQMGGATYLDGQPSLAVTYDTEKGSIHLSGIVHVNKEEARKRSPNSLVDYLELEMDIYSRQDNTVGADGYLTVHSVDSEYLIYHIMLTADYGFLGEQYMKPGRDAFVTMLDQEQLIGAKIEENYDIQREKQEDGSEIVTLVPKMFPDDNGTPPLVDVTKEAMENYLKKQQALADMGVKK